tara:strand:- start:625 stop:1269 length:645 start_codon:yes stop_codon:yes gene_type:complete
MKNTELILFIALSLAFFWAGNATADTDSNVWLVLKDLLQVIASLLTLIVAYKALTTWKEQHVHIERYKAVVSIEKSVHNFHSTYRHYINAASHLRRLESNGEHRDSLKPIADKEPELAVKLNSDVGILFDSIDWAETFLTPDELDKIKTCWKSVVASLNRYNHCHHLLLDKDDSSTIKEVELIGYARYMKDIGILEQQMKDEIARFKTVLLLMR